MEAKQVKEDAQDEAEGLAAWQFLGAKPEQLYLLSEGQLEKQCADRNVPLPQQQKSCSRKTDLIAALADSRALVTMRFQQSFLPYTC